MLLFLDLKVVICNKILLIIICALFQSHIVDNGTGSCLYCCYLSRLLETDSLLHEGI